VSAPGAAPVVVSVWDAPLRAFHWLLVVLVAFSWWSAENGVMHWHRYSGYTVLTLLLFRLYWGFAGSTTARFAQFVRGPRAVWASLRERKESPVGHTPHGGWSVIALLGLLLAQTGSGLFAVDTDGLESGPLATWISFGAGRNAAELHELGFNLLLALIALHVLAIAAYWLVSKRNLLGPMLSGRAAVDPAAAKRLHHAGWARALPGLITAALLVLLLVR
jgi:cytochrome b